MKFQEPGGWAGRVPGVASSAATQVRRRFEAPGQRRQRQRDDQADRREADAVGRLGLPAVDALDPGAQDLQDVGTGVERQRERAGEERSFKASGVDSKRLMFALFLPCSLEMASSPVVPV